VHLPGAPRTTDQGCSILERSTPIPGGSVDVVRRSDLEWGDVLFVTTRNSTYCISKAGGGSWFVWGGWFENHDHAPALVGINGCTWGGTVVHSDVLAAPGLFLEFANGVTTTRIHEVRILRAAATPGPPSC
jgi:hypothetical protein